VTGDWVINSIFSKENKRMQEYIIRDLINFPLEVGNFDKYLSPAKKRLIDYLDSRNKQYREWKILELECIESLASDNNLIHYNFIFDTEKYCVELFKTDGANIASGTVFNTSYEHYNNEFKIVKIGRFFDVELSGRFWMNLEKIKEYLMEQRTDLAKLQPQSIVMFESKDLFQKDVIFGFRFINGGDFSVFSKQPHGYAEPYKILDKYFHGREVRNYFGEEKEPNN
jgi:hypothetical protein